MLMNMSSLVGGVMAALADAAITPTLCYSVYLRSVRLFFITHVEHMLCGKRDFE